MHHPGVVDDDAAVGLELLLSVQAEQGRELALGIGLAQEQGFVSLLLECGREIFARVLDVCGIPGCDDQDSRGLARMDAIEPA